MILTLKIALLETATVLGICSRVTLTPNRQILTIPIVVTLAGLEIAVIRVGSVIATTQKLVIVMISAVVILGAIMTLIVALAVVTAGGNACF